MLEKFCGTKGNACHRFWEALDGMLTGANLRYVMFTASTVGTDGGTGREYFGRGTEGLGLP